MEHKYENTNVVADAPLQLGNAEAVANGAERQDRQPE
jgi:hypothetical protein